MFSKQVENTVGKGEIAQYEQFLLFHNVLKRLVRPTCKNQGLFGKGLIKEVLDTDWIENIVEKGDIAHFQEFHLFPQCFQKLFSSMS